MGGLTVLNQHAPAEATKDHTSFSLLQHNPVEETWLEDGEGGTEDLAEDLTEEVEMLLYQNGLSWMDVGWGEMCVPPAVLTNELFDAMVSSYETQSTPIEATIPPSTVQAIVQAPTTHFEPGYSIPSDALSSSSEEEDNLESDEEEEDDRIVNIVEAPSEESKIRKLAEEELLDKITRRLPAEKLGGVVDILTGAHKPAEDEEEEEEFVVDLSTLDEATLNELHAYVDSKRGKKRPAPPARSTRQRRRGDYFAREETIALTQEEEDSQEEIDVVGI
ncbi:uncharacterized protein VTP21DRAFT_10739 [Calcarisporiella thermophila]|uniref:uncharacterized protein n=1 Tax=Calcarisporiella thermophila TaxID=911321 RepID=UPI00374316E1